MIQIHLWNPGRKEPKPNPYQKKYQCHECHGVEGSCEDYTPRQKGLHPNLCIWKTSGIETRSRE